MLLNTSTAFLRSRFLVTLNRAAIEPQQIEPQRIERPCEVTGAAPAFRLAGARSRPTMARSKARPKARFKARRATRPRLGRGRRGDGDLRLPDARARMKARWHGAGRIVCSGGVRQALAANGRTRGRTLKDRPLSTCVVRGSAFAGDPGRRLRHGAVPEGAAAREQSATPAPAFSAPGADGTRVS
jgi:hypothetical protein